MKFIVIGLGYFGSTLAVNLTMRGHEVIGIDNRFEKIEEFKDTITHVMVMDTTNEKAVKSLPLDDTDAVIVAIGEDVGSSILTLSILKNLDVNHIIGRIISPIHHSILKQIGIIDVVHPEEETAFSVISKLQLKNAIRVIELSNSNVIAELYTPKKYINRTLDSINIFKRFNLKLVAVNVAPVKINDKGILEEDYKLNYEMDTMSPLGANDILIVAGEMSGVRRFIDE